MGLASWEFWLAADVHGTAAVSFGFSESLTGSETFTATGAVAFTFSETESGAETFTGTGALSFTFSEALTGLDSHEGTGAIAFGCSIDAIGSTPVVELDPGVWGTPRKANPLQHLDNPLDDIAASGGVTFGYSTRADGLVDDDELAFLLIAA